MSTALRITFRHLTPSPALESRIRECFAHLEKLHDRVTGCDVVITAPAHRRMQGASFGVRIDLTLPDRHLHVQNGGADPADADAHVAVRHTFGALERMMQRHLYARHHPRDTETIRRTPAQGVPL
jgi:ribosome-associated translation inhibitor RaiA